MMPYGKKGIVLENEAHRGLLKHISYLCDHFEMIHQAIICPLFCMYIIPN